MEQWEIELNKESAEDQKRQCGYAPNPTCIKCNGLGFVHPLDYKHSPIYSEVIPCDAPRCLAESKDHRNL